MALLAARAGSPALDVNAAVMLAAVVEYFMAEILEVGPRACMKSRQLLACDPCVCVVCVFGCGCVCLCVRERAYERVWEGVRACERLVE